MSFETGKKFMKSFSEIKNQKYVPDDPKKYSRLTKHQTITFCSIT